MEKKTEGTLLENQTDSFHVIKNNYRYWAADPFVFSYQDDTYIFAELYDYVEARGGLGYCKWLGNGFSSWKKVISEPYHLSYPYIYEKNNQIFILPESGASGLLYCYKAINFPDCWEKVQILRRDVMLGDTTPFSWNGHDYALSYDVHDPDEYQLCLLDLENAENDVHLRFLDYPELRRPAGKPFLHNECWIRPAQNCTNHYGEGLVFYSFSMSEGQYEETLEKKLYPDELKYSYKILLDGMHTYNFNDEFEVIDIKTRRFNLLNFIFRMKNKIWR